MWLILNHKLKYTRQMQSLIQVFWPLSLLTTKWWPFWMFKVVIRIYFGLNIGLPNLHYVLRDPTKWHIAILRDKWSLWPHILCSWPLFDDHMGCWKVVKRKKLHIFKLPGLKKVCFELPQVYSTIKNHRNHMTTFFVLMTTIWWPDGVWKVVKF